MIRTARRLRGRLDHNVLTSEVLRDNPLGDPHVRELTVYLPPEYDAEPDRRFPVFVDVVGFMGSGPAHLGWRAFGESVPLRLERLVRAKKMGPVIAVFPDCWTRLGGNQYINSSAVGDYADYLLREVLPEVDRSYRTFGDAAHRAVFGKSSGGYGAIIHAMRYARHWGAAACHSGDMYFDFCYRPDLPSTLGILARHGSDPASFLRSFYRKEKANDADVDALMFLAMAAFYDPDPEAPLGFHLPMDLHTGEVDERRWKRWLRHDPIHIVDRKSAKSNLQSLRGLFVDCGERDQYHLVYGARILHRKLQAARIPHHYEEFDDDHSSIDYRLDVSLPFLYQALMGRKGVNHRRG
jgi:enterochelin esterase-like enzyme